MILTVNSLHDVVVTSPKYYKDFYLKFFTSHNQTLEFFVCAMASLN